MLAKGKKSNRQYEIHLAGSLQLKTLELSFYFNLCRPQYSNLRNLGALNHEIITTITVIIPPKMMAGCAPP